MKLFVGQIRRLSCITCLIQEYYVALEVKGKERKEECTDMDRTVEESTSLTFRTNRSGSKIDSWGMPAL